MVRLVGILCGSALAIAFLIIALGLPEVLPGSTDEGIATNTSGNSPTIVEEQVASVFEPVAEPMPEPSAQENWYAFWSPFRSELAANGFVSQLQKTTGMDYRVVRLKPGVYEVAFAYVGDEDIAAKLAAISTATGLEMPDG